MNPMFDVCHLEPSKDEAVLQSLLSPKMRSGFTIGNAKASGLYLHSRHRFLSYQALAEALLYLQVEYVTSQITICETKNNRTTTMGNRLPEGTEKLVC
jgi:hypothetical protein